MEKMKQQKNIKYFSQSFLILGLILACSNCSLMNNAKNTIPPEWYKNQIISSTPKKIVGYGVGTTLYEAQTLAKRNIAEQIQVAVTSQVTIERFQSNKSWHKKFNDIVNVSSQVVLGTTPIIKKKKQGSMFYVALEYDNRALFTKVKDSCEKLNDLSKTDLHVYNNDYKNSLPFFRQLISHGVEPEGFRLQRNNALWYIDICNSTLWIRPDILFKQFYTEKKNSSCINLRLVPQNHLSNKDKYFIEITTFSKGYLSLFHVTETGQVLELLLNKPVNQNQTIVYPDRSKYDGLLADAGDFNQTRDLILGTWAEEPSETLASFMAVSKKNIEATDERTYCYDQLLETIRGHCWASQFVYIN